MRGDLRNKIAKTIEHKSECTTRTLECRLNDFQIYFPAMIKNV
jgi:hypothetical protein